MDKWYRKISRASKTLGKKAWKGTQTLAESGSSTVKKIGENVGKTASHTAKAVGSSTAAKTTAYALKYGLHGAANALEAGIPLLGGTVADKLLRFDDTQRLLKRSPQEQDKKLEQYNQSYNLTKYKALCKKSQQQTHEGASALLMQRTKDRFDVMSVEAINKAFKASEASATRDNKLAAVNQRLAQCIPKTKLSDLQQKYKKILQGIEKGEKPNDPALADPDIQIYHQPQEVIIALEETLKRSKAELEAERKQAIDAANKLFEPSPAGDADFKKNIASLLGIRDPQINNSAHVDALVAQHQAHFIQQIEDSYKKAESTLNAGFEDKKNQKDANGKELPDEHGIISSAKNLKQICEADLLVRINEYEYRKNLDAQFNVAEQGLRGSAGGITDPACLKGVSLKKIKNKEVAGIWATYSVDYHTTSGTKLNVREKDDGNVEISMSVSGLAFPYHVVSPERLQEDFEDMVERTLATKDKLEIEWNIEARTDDLRNKMIIAAYKASIAKKIDPKNITMTVTGGSKEQTFMKKPIEEILASLSLSTQDAKFIESIRKEQEENVKQKHAPNERAFADKFRAQLGDIKARGIEASDELDLTPPSPSIGKSS